jgi:ligand-binding sensor domain-containing protein
MKMKRLIHLLIILVFLFSCKPKKQNSNSEDSIEDSSIDRNNTFSAAIKFDTIFVSQAPKRITRNIKLDKEGSLLIAAYDDIVRYDGDSFTHLKKEVGLESWYAFDVLEDRKGNIWIASDQLGAFRIDAETGAITNFNTNDGLGHKRNMCVYEDKTGNIWIGGQGGLSKYDGIEFTNFTKEDGLPHNDINTILEDSSGNLWFGTRGNAGLYDGNTFSEIKNNEGKAFFNVWSIIEDKSGYIWLIDSSGLWKYSGGTFTHELTDVWKIYQGNKNDFWLSGMIKGGGSKLKRIEANSMVEKEFIITEIFKTENMIFDFVEDAKGNIWIGGGDGVWLYNGKTINYYTGILSNNK